MATQRPQDRRTLPGEGVDAASDVPAPVSGTAQPPRLLSGALRRAAYRIPDRRTSHWLLLLLADRVDVLEHRLGAALPFVPALAAGLVGYAAVRRALRAGA